MGSISALFISTGAALGQVQSKVTSTLAFAFLEKQLIIDCFIQNFT